MADNALKSQRFRSEREWDWRRLEGLLRKLEERSASALTDEDLLALPVLYRSTLSSLNVARATSLDKALVDYLESLCTRAYFFVYGPRSTLAARLAKFFARDLPLAVAGLWRETLVSGALMALGAVVAFILVSGDPDWYYAFVDKDLAAGRDPSAPTDMLHDGLYDPPDVNEGLSVFAAFLFTHNAQVAILAFALGFAFCLPTTFLLVATGAMVGAFLALYADRGLGMELGGWLLIHGVTELFAVVLAGAAGLRIGWTLAFPGPRGRQETMAATGRQAATVLGGVVVMLLFAGLLEGFGRQLITEDWMRYSIAAVTGLIWLTYYYMPKREEPDGLR